MNKEEILIALKEIHARYCIPASEQNYTDKDYACMQYEKLVIHLQNEIGRLNNIINGLEIFIKNNKVAIGIKKGSNYAIPVEYVLDKLKELKDNNK